MKDIKINMSINLSKISASNNKLKSVTLGAQNQEEFKDYESIDDLLHKIIKSSHGFNLTLINPNMLKEALNEVHIQNV